MGAQQRIYRQKSRSVQSMKKITRAMELIAASRVVKARERVVQTTPYARAITKAVSAVATFSSDIDHPLTLERENPTKAGVLIITSDRGLAGAYSANALKRSESLRELLQEEGREVVPYLAGRKAEGFYRFRQRPFEESWSGFSDAPTYEVAKEIGDRLTADFIKGAENGGVDEIHPAEGRGARHVGSNRLGHKDASVTLTIYAHHIPEDSRRTLNAFTRAVWGA